MDEGTHLRDVLSLAIQSASLPTQLPADAESSIHKIRLISADTAFEVWTRFIIFSIVYLFGREPAIINAINIPFSSEHSFLAIYHYHYYQGQETQGVQINGVVSPRSSFISTNSSSTSGVSSGGSFGTLPSKFYLSCVWFAKVCNEM